MLKGAFIGGGRDFTLGPSFFAGGDLELSTRCPALPQDAWAYGDPKVMLPNDQGLEFAAINLPPGDSFRAIQLALERGLHVICQPPFCSTTSEFETLRAAAEKAGKTIFPVQPWEHAASWLALDKALTGGLAGEINYAEVQVLTSEPAPEGGAIELLGWQAFSMLLAMIRRPPSAIEARLTPGSAAGFHAHFGGVDGFVHLSCGSHAPRLRAAVSGDKGRLEMDGNMLRLDIKDLPRETVILRNELVPGANRPEWMIAELLDFKKEIEGLLPRGYGLRNSRYCIKLLRNAVYSALVKSAAVPL